MAKSISTFCFLLPILSCIVNHDLAFSQIIRSWDFSYNQISNYEAVGQSIIVLPSGKSVTAGTFKSSTENRKNALLLVDESGTFLDVDTSNPGFGYRKVIYDGNGTIYAAATLSNDSLPINKLVVARFDTTFSDRHFFVPDSATTFPGYDVLDMSILSNSTIVVASHWDAFPLVNLSLLCMDTSGTVLWERIDSSFEFGYDVKLLADSSGGLFVAGSGRDTSTAQNFVFVSHYLSQGIRDWFVQNYSSQPYAELNDVIIDINKNLYVSAILMDSTGQVGRLMKLDSLGNVLWDNSILPLPYSGIVSDDHGNIYGVTIPQNGVDVLTIEKLDSSGTFINRNSYQNNFYFTSDLGDLRMLDNGIIAATGGLYVLSFPKSDLYFVTFDTSLTLTGYDIFNSQNLLGEYGRSISDLSNNSVYVCGRFNFENQFETCNIGIAKYDLSGLLNGISSFNSIDLMIFPNPSTGNFRIKSTTPWKSKLQIHIFKMLGEAVYKNIFPAPSDELEFRLDLKPGIYFATFESEKNRFVSKISITE